MAELTVITIPHPALKKPALPVETVDDTLKKFLHSLEETMLANSRCVGIAAPQVAMSLRIIIVDVSLYPKPFTNHGRLVLINPVIIEKDGRRLGREGCLSVPQFTGVVVRAEKVTVEALDALGNRTRIEALGFEAVVLQHEIDHLDGILFLDRVSSIKTDIFRRRTP